MSSHMKHNLDWHCLTVNMKRYLRAVSPSVPSTGSGGSLDRAWDRKRRGTAHQCLEPICWISCSNTGATKQTQQSVTDRLRSIVTSYSLCSYTAPLCSDGRLLKKAAMKTWSLAPSSGQSPTLCPTDLHVDRRWINEDVLETPHNNRHCIISFIPSVHWFPVSPVEERSFRQNIHERPNNKLWSKV